MKKLGLFCLFSFVMLSFAIRAGDPINELFWSINLFLDGSHIWMIIRKHDSEYTRYKE